MEQPKDKEGSITWPSVTQLDPRLLLFLMQSIASWPTNNRRGEASSSVANFLPFSGAASAITNAAASAILSRPRTRETERPDKEANSYAVWTSRGVRVILFPLPMDGCSMAAAAGAIRASSPPSHHKPRPDVCRLRLDTHSPPSFAPSTCRPACLRGARSNR